MLMVDFSKSIMNTERIRLDVQECQFSYALNELKSILNSDSESLFTIIKILIKLLIKEKGF